MARAGPRFPTGNIFEQMKVGVGGEGHAGLSLGFGFRYGREVFGLVSGLRRLGC